MKVYILVCVLIASFCFQETCSASVAKDPRVELQLTRHTLKKLVNEISHLVCLLKYNTVTDLTFFKENSVKNITESSQQALEHLREEINKQKANGKDEQKLEECYSKAEDELETLKFDAEDSIDKRKSSIKKKIETALQKLENAHAPGVELLDELDKIIPSCEGSENVDKCISSKLEYVNSGAKNSIEKYADNTYDISLSITDNVNALLQTEFASNLDIVDSILEGVSNLRQNISKCFDEA